MRGWPAFLVGLLACGSDPVPPVDAVLVTDASPDSADASTVIPWESVETISDDGQVIVELVSYRSEGLRIYARVCRPKSGDRFGMLVYNHGGTVGLGVDPEVARCAEVARFGYVWMGSSYRGEDGSEGRVEVCLGGVTDVLELVRVGASQPYVDASKIVMWGGSHGGCITTRAVQRGAPVIAAIDVFGPTDWAKLHAYWSAQIAANAPNASTLEQLRDMLETATGGTPQTRPAEYAARSPIHALGDLPASVPFLVAQGASDDIVPPVQSCDLAAPLALESYHVDGNGAEVTTAPAGCEASGITWRPGPRPTSWPGSRYLVVYDGVGHETTSPAAERMLGDLAGFLMAKLR